MASSSSAVSAPLAAAAELQVQRWMEANGLTSEADLAFAFLTWKEALEVAGRCVAVAWARVQSGQANQRDTAKQFFEAITAKKTRRPAQESERGRSPTRGGRGRGKGRCAGGKRSAKKAAEETSITDDMRIGWLVEVMQVTGALKPKNHRTSHADWTKALQRRAYAKVVGVRHSERETLLRVKHTWDELKEFAKERRLRVS